MWNNIISIIEILLLLVVLIKIDKSFENIGKGHFLKTIRDEAKAEAALKDIKDLRDELRKIESEEGLRLWQAYAIAHSNEDYSPLGFVLGFIITLASIICSFLFAGQTKVITYLPHFLFLWIVIFLLISRASLEFKISKSDNAILREAIDLVIQERKEQKDNN